MAAVPSPAPYRGSLGRYCIRAPRRWLVREGVYSGALTIGAPAPLAHRIVPRGGGPSEAEAQGGAGLQRLVVRPDASKWHAGDGEKGWLRLADVPIAHERTEGDPAPRRPGLGEQRPAQAIAARLRIAHVGIGAALREIRGLLAAHEVVVFGAWPQDPIPGDEAEAEPDGDIEILRQAIVGDRTGRCPAVAAHVVQHAIAEAGEGRNAEPVVPDQVGAGQ